MNRSSSKLQEQPPPVAEPAVNQAEVVAPAQPPESRRLGQYEFVRAIGCGGMGTVYEVVHSHLQRRLALKTISVGQLNDKTAVPRFYREMAMIGTLDHPNIVRAYDAGEVDGFLYLAMELVDGYDVESLNRLIGQFSDADCCEIVRQSALALGYAHKLGLVHRDIKPANLLLASDGTVKVSDLGLARAINQPKQQGITESGIIVGTPDYMSPEHAQGGSEIGPPSDIYSLGCTLYRLITGRVPFDCPKYDTAIRKVMGHIHDDPLPPSVVRDDVPGTIDSVIRRMMAKEPENRFETMEEVAEQIAPLAADSDLAALAARAPRQSDLSENLPSGFRSTATYLGSTKFYDTHQVEARHSRPRWLWAAAFAVVLIVVAMPILLSGVLNFPSDDDDQVVDNNNESVRQTTPVRPLADGTGTGSATNAALPAFTKGAVDTLA